MKVYFILFACCLVKGVSAQAVLGGVQSKGMDMNAQPYGFITEIKAEPKEVKGSTYLYEQWALGGIYFSNGSKLVDVYFRYDMRKDFFEIKIDGTVRGSDGGNVKRFEIMNSLTQERELYVSATEFNINGTKLIGFLRELQIGDYSLYSRSTVKLIKGTYVMALDIGDNEDAYVKNTVYYLGKKAELHEIGTNKKRFSRNFPHKEKEILKYIKDHGLSLKDEKQLVEIIDYANKLN